MSTLTQHILEDKRQRRLELAALPFPEKVKIVEQMRETVRRIRRAGVSDSRGRACPGAMPAT
jgi:hypothetical protein